jgi:methionyl-tRNA formyltransferase
MALQKLRIVYMGTPEFAIAPLEALLEHGFDVAAVVSSPDKPAGRGMKMHQPAVARFALAKGLPLLQPPDLKAEAFIEQLRALRADLFIVVAFRKLPQVVWQMPGYGTFNLHASLLPQYRGAAPINRAVMNGETETGITTFFLSDSIDTGKIILQESIPILFEDTAGVLHDRMMIHGAAMVVRTAQAIADSDFTLTAQDKVAVAAEALKIAPKIFKEDCRINWVRPARDIYNQIRGLSPFPGAFTYLRSPGGRILQLKIFISHIEAGDPIAGNLTCDGKSFLKIAATDGFIVVDELQLEGKKRMHIQEFLRGFQVDNQWRISTTLEFQSPDSQKND